MLNELNVQSVVTAPAHDEMIALTAQGTYTVKGFAYSGLMTNLIALLQVTHCATQLSRCNTCQQPERCHSSQQAVAAKIQLRRNSRVSVHYLGACDTIKR